MNRSAGPSFGETIRAAVELFASSEKVRFLIVGGYNTVFGYFSFAAVYWLFDDQLHYIVISVVTHFFAVTNSFLTQKILVFRSRGSFFREYLKFQLAYLASMPIGIFFLALFYDYLGLHILIAQALGLCVVVIFSFLAGRRFIFKHENE